MTRPPHDEQERATVEALKEARNSITNPGLYKGVISAIDKALAAYTKPKRHTMPEWEVFSEGKRKDAGGNGAVVGKMFITESEYNAIREALAEEVE